MASYTATREALVAYLLAGYAALNLYPDPTDDLTAADDISGWVEMEWAPGPKGPSGGRLGPTSTHYESRLDLTLRILIPRLTSGDRAAWTAAWAQADTLEALILEAQIGDLVIESVQPRPHELEDADTHIQIDLACSGTLESVMESNAVSSLGGIATSSGVYSSALGPGLRQYDWVGVVAGPVWRRVGAREGEPRALGVVSRVPDGTFTVTFSGAVDLPGHPWEPGPLYLDQVTNGAATNDEPKSGVLQQVGQVVDERLVIVLQLPGVSR